MNDDNSFHYPPRWLISIAIMWLFVAGLLFFQFWPDLPRNKQQWTLFFTLFPPLYVAGEAWCAWLFSPSRGWAISHRWFSLVRIALAVPIALAWFALSWYFATFFR